jgi:hypothetical protein
VRGGGREGCTACDVCKRRDLQEVRGKSRFKELDVGLQEATVYEKRKPEDIEQIRQVQLDVQQ